MFADGTETTPHVQSTLLNLVRRAQQRSSAALTSRMEQSGYSLTATQYVVMLAIAEAPGSDQSTIARNVSHDKATIGGVIDRLEVKGLIERSVSLSDRRVHPLHLTEDGQAIMTELNSIAMIAEDEALAALNKKERRRLLELLLQAVEG